MPNIVTDAQDNRFASKTLGLVLIPIVVILGIAGLAVYLSDLGSRRIGQVKDWLRQCFHIPSKRNREHQNSDCSGAECQRATQRPSEDLSVDLRAGALDPDAELKL